MSTKNKWKDSKFTTTSNEVRAVANCSVAVEVEAILRERDGVRLSLLDESDPLLKDLTSEASLLDLTAHDLKPP
jgi:hypothetical protein